MLHLFRRQLSCQWFSASARHSLRRRLHDAPLEGVTVLALEQAIAGPLCTRHLADAGARVIKIERCGSGDYIRKLDDAVHGYCSHFVWANAGKRSMTLNVKHERGRRVLSDLIRNVDCFVHNLVPGAVERLGLTRDELHQLNPALVHCGISGYGQGGEMEAMKAYDLLVQAEAGLLDITGTSDVPCKVRRITHLSESVAALNCFVRLLLLSLVCPLGCSSLVPPSFSLSGAISHSPAQVGVAIADVASGLYAFNGILLALLRRYRTGKGQALHISMLDALGEFMQYPYLYTGYPGEKSARGLSRTDARHNGVSPYGPFLTKSGPVLLAVQNERDWKRFCCDVLMMPELETDGRFHNNSARLSNRGALESIIQNVFVSLDRSEVMSLLERANIAVASMRTVLEAAQHPQFVQRSRFRSVRCGAKEIQMLRPVVYGDDDGDEVCAVPEVGEHTHEILRDTLHLTDAQISELRDEGVID